MSISVAADEAMKRRDFGWHVLVLLPWLSLDVDSSGGWFRIGGPRGPGLSLLSTPPLYCERAGGRLRLVQWGKWRLLLVERRPAS